MTRKELETLRVGDMCTISKGLNKGRKVEVVQIFGEFVTVRPADGMRFNIAANSKTVYEIEKFSYKCLDCLYSQSSRIIPRL